jgi:hypothetical protein
MGNNSQELLDVMSENPDVTLNFPCSDDGICPLMIVTVKGNIEMLSAMLSNRNVDVNYTDKLGTNAFWMATLHGKRD